MNIKDHVNNEQEIKNSKFIGCLSCHRVFSVDELDWLEEFPNYLLDLNTYCPLCRVADKLIGDASGIELTPTNLKSLEYEIYKKE